MSDESPEPAVSPQGVIAKATANTEARVGAASPIPLAAETQPEATQGAQITPTVPETPAQGDTNAPPSYFWEGDYQGQKLGLSKEESEHLIRMALDAINSAKQRQPEAPPQAGPKEEETVIPPEAKKLLDAYMKPFMSEFNSMKEKLTQAERKQLANQVNTECAELIDKNETLKRLKGNSKIGTRLPGMIMALAYANPDMSLQTAAQLVAETWEEAKTQENKDYVQAKVSQAAHRVEGAGGAVHAPGGKKLGAQDLFNDKVKQSAISRLQRAMGAR